jgi:hypothetical protein
MFHSAYWTNVYTLFNAPIKDSWGITRHDQIELLVNMILVSHQLRIGFIIDKLDYENRSDYELALQTISRAYHDTSEFMGLLIDPLAMIHLSFGTYVCLRSRTKELVDFINEHDTEKLSIVTSLPNPKNDGTILLRIRTQKGGVVVSNWCKEEDVSPFLNWAQTILKYITTISDNMIHLYVDRYVEK